MNKRLIDDFRNFIQKIDPRSWPAFFMFFIVLIAAGGLNYLGMRPITGNWIAVGIALFFGVGVLSWHIVEARTDDSKYQEDVAKSVKWLNVVLDFVLLIINLFRADLRSNNMIDGLTWWDGLAYTIVGLSAAAHVVGYLLWTENDPRRNLNKDRERGLHDVGLKRQGVQSAIMIAEEEMKAIRFATEEEKRLRDEFTGNIPQTELERLVKEARENAMKNFKRVVAQKPQAQERKAPQSALVLATDTNKVEPEAKPAHNYTLAEFLRSIDQTAESARQMLKQYNLTTADEAWGALRNYGVLPSDLTRGNFNRLFGELVNPQKGDGQPK